MMKLFVTLRGSTLAAIILTVALGRKDEDEEDSCHFSVPNYYSNDMVFQADRRNVRFWGFGENLARMKCHILLELDCTGFSKFKSIAMVDKVGKSISAFYYIHAHALYFWCHPALRSSIHIYMVRELARAA
jgi:hypothetical protein